MNNYVVPNEITKEFLDTINVGNLVKINDWKKPMRVKGVSENYLVMHQNLFGNDFYSVMEKIPNKIRHNSMMPGLFHCGTDHWVFGYSGMDDYSFTNCYTTKDYLQSFEDGESKLSERTSVPIRYIAVKH
jgi:hypothetical protein